MRLSKERQQNNRDIWGVAKIWAKIAIMIECPKCHRKERQNKAGRTGSGSQRYRCMFCQIKYTPEPKAWAYDEKVRKKALELYVDGMNLRRIARHLGTHHRTISLWVQAYVATLPKAPVPESVETAELDELFTFVEKKKTSSTSSRK